MAHEIYLHLDSIPGECNETYHKQWIVIDSFSCSIEAAGGSGDSSGACEHAPMEISKHIDRSSPKLALAACQRTEFNKATIDICKPTSTGLDSSVILKCILSGVTCLSYNLSGEDNSTDTVSLKYDIIEWHYMQVDSYTLASKGKIVTKWDTLKNTGG